MNGLLNIMKKIIYFKFINETIFEHLIQENKSFINQIRKTTNIFSLYFCKKNDEIKWDWKKISRKFFFCKDF